MRLPLLRAAAVLTIILTSRADAQIVAGNRDLFDGECVPLGCFNPLANRYQQIYSSGLFHSPIFIDALTIFRETNRIIPFNPTFAGGIYNFYLATSSRAVNDLSTSFEANLNSPLTLFASFLIPGGTSATATSFTLNPASSFFYDPGAGNLLLDVQYQQNTFNTTTYFQVDRSGTEVSSVHGFGNEGVASSTGLVTRIDGQFVTVTPEPATVALLATGLIVVACIARRRSRNREFT